MPFIVAMLLEPQALAAVNSLLLMISINLLPKNDVDEERELSLNICRLLRVTAIAKSIRTYL
jgi:hypothetical protein